MTLRVALLLLTSCVFTACSLRQSTVPAPQADTPLPVPRPGEITEIGIAHTACFGTCPIYKFTLRRLGASTYEGERWTPIVGIYEGAIDSTAFDRLARVVIRRGFFDLRDSYVEGATDLPSTITTVTVGPRHKAVLRYGRGAPGELYDIEEAIDSAGARIPWRPSPR